MNADPIPLFRRTLRGLGAGWLPACVLLVCAFGDANAQARNGNVVLLYDSSGSMGAETTQGERKMVVARSVVHDLMAGLQQENAGHQVGIVAFGHSFPSKREFRDRSCRDIEILRSRQGIGAQTVADFGQAVDKLEPRGYTPISDAIRKVDAALGPEGGTIILITDFEDTCEPSPNAACQALQAINQSRSEYNRVYIDSIIVPKAPDMNTGPVTNLKNCSGARYLELFSVADSHNRMPEIVRRLAQYARATEPKDAAPKPTLRVVTLPSEQNGQGRKNYTARIRYNNGTTSLLDRTITVPNQPLPLDANIYDVLLLDGEQTVAERTAIPLKAGDEVTVYFSDARLD